MRPAFVGILPGVSVVRDRRRVRGGHRHPRSGGGHQIQAYEYDRDKLKASASYVSGSTWRAQIRNDSFGANGGVVQAICTSLPGRTTGSTSVSVGAGSTAWQAKDCGATRWLVGGGWITNQNIPHNIVTAALPTDAANDNWKINLANGDSVAHTVQLIHVCLLSSGTCSGPGPADDGGSGADRVRPGIRDHHRTGTPPVERRLARAGRRREPAGTFAMGAAVIGARVGSGREAEVYAWGDDAVVKLYRPGFGGHRAEAAALSALDGHGVAPRLIDVVEHEGRRGLVLERLDGLDMLTLLQRHPARVLSLARALAEAHRAVHAVAAPASLPDLRHVLATRIEGAALPSPLRAFALSVLDGLPDGDRLSHGDFHPGNVLVAGDQPRVIDWVGATRGVPEADHARTLLLLRWSDLPSGTPAAFRALLRAGRSVLAYQYARAYFRGSSRRSSIVEAWLTVHAAARLWEGIEAEHPALIGLVERARRNPRSGGGVRPA